MAKKINITAQLNAATTDGILASANQIYDENKGKFQEQVNQEVESALEEAITSEDTGVVVESIEEGIIHNALRKNKQILTEAEKYQARHNISAITAEEAEKIAQDKINESAVSSPDKLQAVKELSSWLESNPDNAATMNAAIQDNSADIQRLYRGTGIGEYSEFSSLTDYAAGAVVLYDGVQFRFKVDHAKGAWDYNEVEEWSEKKEREKKLTELESKGIIALSYKAISNIVANLEVGEYGWNDSINKLIKKTSEDGEYNTYTPDVNAGLYVYNGAYYRFNGNKLEAFAVQNNIFNSIILENGAIDSAGQLKDNSTRVRSANSLYGGFNIYIPNPSIVVYAVVYYTHEGTFDSWVQINDRYATNLGKDGCVAKLVFAHKDLSSAITAKDIKTALGLELLQDDIKTLQDDIKTLQDDLIKATIHDIAWEQGGLNIAGGQETISSSRIRNANYIMGAMRLTLPEHLHFLSVCYYDEVTHGFVSYDTAMAGQSFAIIGMDGCVAKVAVAKKAGGNISIEDLKNSDALDVAYAQATHTAPLAEFNYDHELKDVSKDIEDFTIRWAEATVMEQVYEHFDDLCGVHPHYISKVDAAELAGLSYPAYANLNGVASGAYLATPSYKTYLYKLIDNNANAGSAPGGVNEKRKLFIVGGTHGIEVAGCVNSYLFAKMLCEGRDVNYFKLRESFDIYIIPCLNGYGIYNNTRVNANGVDINRNYPIKGWSSNGSVGDVDYTGATAGSEFETQLIMALTSQINPDIAIDHHNYWPNLKWQFYTNVKKTAYVPLIYQSLVDCSFAFIKGLPAYFGTSPKLFLEGSGSSISGTYVDNTGTTLAWWDENGVKISSTLEICCGIGYMDGIHIEGEEGYDYYGADTFSIAEYTLRNQVLRFCDYCMKRL